MAKMDHAALSAELARFDAQDAARRSPPDPPPYDDLDPGIRETVRWITSLGFTTTDSGDGVSKGDTMECALDFPHVHIQIKDPSDGVLAANTLHDDAVRRGIVFLPTGPAIEANYSPLDGMTVLSLYMVDDAMLAAATPEETS